MPRLLTEAVSEACLPVTTNLFRSLANCFASWSRDPLRLSAGRAWVITPQNDARCRPSGATSRSQPRGHSRRQPRKVTHAMGYRPDQIGSCGTPFKVRYTHQPEHLRPVRFYPCEQTVVRSRDDSPRQHTLQYLFDILSSPPSSRATGRPSHLVFAANKNTNVLERTRTDTSLRSLQPTCCQPAPADRSNLDLPGSRPSSAPLTSPSPSAPKYAQLHHVVDGRSACRKRITDLE